MSVTEQVAEILQTEKDRKVADSQFARAVDTIDHLKKEGVLTPTRYKLPLSDTVGRHIAQEATRTVDAAPSQATPA